MIENQKIELELKVLKALLFAAGKDDPRPYFNGIAIKDGFLVSADGYRSARWKFPTESESFRQLEVIMPRKAVETAVSLEKSDKRLKKCGLYLKHNQEDDNCSFEFVDEDGNVAASTNFLREAVKYPNVSKVFDEANAEPQPAKSTLPANQLADLYKMQRALGVKYGSVNIVTNGMKACTASFCSDFGRFEVLIMPMR